MLKSSQPPNEYEEMLTYFDMTEQQFQGLNYAYKIELFLGFFKPWRSPREYDDMNEYRDELKKIARTNAGLET